MSNSYTVFGLTLQSDIVLPELFSAGPGAMPDVTVRYDAVDPDTLGEAARVGPQLWVSPERFILEIPRVARFEVAQGTEIRVDPAPGVDAESVRLFLLGSAFGALLFQRGHLVLHGNAIKIDGRCMICVGASGAGKSTLAAAFARRGYPVLADDVVPVDANAAALPGLPRIKLWQDAAEWLGIETAGLRRIRPDMAKFNMPLAEDDRAVSAPAPIRWIYILGQDVTLEDVRIVPIHGMARFGPLRNNTYRVRYLQGMKLGPVHLERCGALAGQVHLARVTRPDVAGPEQAARVDALVDRLLADMRDNG
ncbi:hypothetical protein [Salibaculum sp.]|uniref:hypothetical protein n=1 Tax=Salibaculum sp. TaxID=2855480 RepID=UPI002B49DA5A|nr:hypothetical protein [Salibaculum sp.]HKL69619.1 hypothetical protein [Salibaculum sp.]